MAARVAGRMAERLGSRFGGKVITTGFKRVFPSLEPEGGFTGKRISALQHPYFKNFGQNPLPLDVFYTSNYFRLSFELIDYDLSKLIKDGPICAPLIKHLLFQILRGACYCHETHDLKPHNLLLDRQTSSLKLADFGLARTFDGAPSEYSYEVGTLAYEAPELILEMRQTTTAADIWSVGCIFAEMVNGTPPFDTKIDVYVMRNIISILGGPTEIEWPGVTSALREFCAHGALQHPYFKTFLQNTQFLGWILLSRLLDVFYTPRLSFEWMDKDIAKLIEFGPISAAPIKHLLFQILQGVYCHYQEVFHRCLKPHNLLLDGQTSSLKLADFGVAQTFDGALAEYSHEVGTPAYIAPELILGMQHTTSGLIIRFWLEVALREFCAPNKIFSRAYRGGRSGTKKGNSKWGRKRKRRIKKIKGVWNKIRKPKEFICQPCQLNNETSIFKSKRLLEQHQETCMQRRIYTMPALGWSPGHAQTFIIVPIVCRCDQVPKRSPLSPAQISKVNQ